MWANLTRRARPPAAAALLLLAGGCARRAEQPQAADSLAQQVEQAAGRQETLQVQLRAMGVAELAARLREESTRGVEPFNSPAYRELVRRGAAAGPELAAQITGADRASLLALLALRRIDPDRYRALGERVIVPILIDALRSSATFNLWGLPHLNWEDAARAVIAAGRVAQGPLMQLLDDKRDAPVWGSEEVAESNRYRYRVCDYAWAMLLAIRGDSLAIPEDPARRDSLIAALRG